MAAKKAKQVPEVRHPCVNCDRRTFHKILFFHTRSEYEYRVDEIHEMLKCLGCRAISFRKRVLDFESAYPIDEHDWEVPEDITCYPSILDGHKELGDIWEVPPVVRDIYLQSVQAMREQSNTLAGIGLRATVEAICNDRDIAGRSLERRIDALAKGGLISHKDAERLHAIRFLGNDAAHEIKKADAKHLLTALRIIEHLLVTLYVLDNEADNQLETILNTFEKFEKFLSKKIPDHAAGEEIPLAKIFGKDMRRFHGYFAAHERDLIEKINAGIYTKLGIGMLEKYGDSKEKVQHFVIK